MNESKCIKDQEHLKRRQEPTELVIIPKTWSFKPRYRNIEIEDAYDVIDFLMRPLDEDKIIDSRGNGGCCNLDELDTE